MVKKALIITLAIIICVVAIIFIKNGQIYDIFTKNSEVKTTYTESQIIKLPMEKVRTLNPITSRDSDTYKLSKLIFESLFYLDENLSLKNQLAESYEYDEDKKTVAIDIRRDSYFSDGTNLTGNDVKYSIDNYISATEKGNGIYGSYVANIKSVSVDRNDKYSIKVKFKDKSDVSMENFVFPIVSEKSFGKNYAYKETSTDFIPIGSGAYAVEKYNDITELQLVANQYYNGNKPTNTLHFTVLPEKEDIIPLLEVNNMSLGCLESLSRDTLIADKKITSTNFPSNEVEVVGYNFSKQAMSNKKVRQAIAYAVNSEDLNETAYYKNGMLCDTIYFPGYLGTKNKGDVYKYNLEKASSLLTSAKYLDRDENGYLEDEEDNELTVDILVNSADQSRKMVAESIKASMDSLSISSRILYADDSEDFKKQLSAKDYDIFVGGLKINETYDLRTLLHSKYNNVIGYSNEKVDVLLDKLKSGVGEEDKIKIVNSTKKILEDEIPYYCIVYKTYGALTSESLNGNADDYIFNNVYNGCEKWYSKYTAEKKEEESRNLEQNDKNIEND